MDVRLLVLALALWHIGLVDQRSSCSFRVIIKDFFSHSNEKYVVANPRYNSSLGFSLVELRQTFINPTWGVRMLRSDGKRTKQMANLTQRVCDLDRISRRFAYGKILMDLGRSVTTMPLVCPLPSGNYTVNVTGLAVKKYLNVGMLFAANTDIIFRCDFYEQLPLGNFTYLADATLIFEIVRCSKT